MTSPTEIDKPYLAALYQALQAGSQDYDRAVLTLSSGTIALSATFAHDIAPVPLASTQYLLLASWGCLLFATITIVLSIRTSQVGLRNLIDDIQNNRIPSEVGTTLLWTDRLNIAAGAGLILGLVLFGFYAAINM